LEKGKGKAEAFLHTGGGVFGFSVVARFLKVFQQLSKKGGKENRGMAPAVENGKKGKEKKMTKFLAP